MLSLFLADVRPRRWLFRFSLILLTLTGLAFAPPTRAADDARRAYNLPAGDAIQTLKRFAQQAGREIVYPVDQVRGVQTKAVRGEFTALEAITRMLEGTTLGATEDQ